MGTVVVVWGEGVDGTSLGSRGAKRDRSTDLATHSGNITFSEALSESRQKKKAGTLEESNLRGERKFD